MVRKLSLMAAVGFPAEELEKVTDDYVCRNSGEVCPEALDLMSKSEPERYPFDVNAATKACDKFDATGVCEIAKKAISFAAMKEV